MATFFAALLVALAAPLHAQSFPELTGRVVDGANIIPDDVEADLVSQLEALETQSQRQMVVVTLSTLEGYDISDYGYQLGREWGLGDEERNDGALLIVAPNERKVRIEVGYGLEPVLTDGLSAIIIQQQILPRFRDDDYPGGIVAGTDAIITQLTLPPEEAARVVSAAETRRDESGGFPIGGLIWIAFTFFFFILPMFRRGRRYRRAGSSVGDIILWEVGRAAARGISNGGGGSSWGGGGGGSFGGGGGFSGGGGSFGGGGASGGW